MINGEKLNLFNFGRTKTAFFSIFTAKTGYAWEEANMHVHGTYKQNDVVRAMPFDLAANETDSDSNSNSNTAWEKAKEACKNVKDGIKSWAKNGKRKHSVDVEIVGGKVSGINENDGMTKSWNDIKEKADAVLEASKEYPGVRIDTKEDPVIHLGMEKVDESGLLEPQHTLYNVFAEGADGANLEQHRKVSDVDTEVFQSGLLEPQHTLYNSFGNGADNIPEFVNKIDNLDEGVVSTGPDDTKFVTTRRFSIKNENENDPHVYEATHERAGTVDLLENADEKKAAVIQETLTGTLQSNKSNLLTLIYFPNHFNFRSNQRQFKSSG